MMKAAPGEHSLVTNRTSSRAQWLLLAIVLVGLGLRLGGLGHASLWFDEWITVDQSTRPTLAESVTASTTHPPVLRILVRAALASAPPDASARTRDRLTRLPGALLGVATLPLLFFLVRRLTGGDERVALLAAALYALSPYGLYYAQEARYYAPVVFFATWVLLAVIRLVERPRSLARHLTLFAALVLAIHTHHLLGVLFLTTFFWVLPHALSDLRARWVLALPWLAAGLSFLPWFTFAMAHLEPQARPWIAGLPQQVLDTGVAFFTGRMGAFHLITEDGAVRLPALGLSAWLLICLGLTLHVRRRRRLPPDTPRFSYGWGTLGLTAGSLAFCAVAHVTSVTSRFFHHKYLAFLVPLLVLSLAELGVGLVDATRAMLRRGARSRKPALLVVAAWALCATGALVAAAELAGPTREAFRRYRPGAARYFHRERYRAAAHYVQTHRRPGDVVVIVDPYERYLNSSLLEHYGLQRPWVPFRPHQLDCPECFWFRWPDTLFRARRLIVIAAHSRAANRERVAAAIRWVFPRRLRRRLFVGAEGTIFVTTYGRPRPTPQ